MTSARGEVERRTPHPLGKPDAIGVSRLREAQDKSKAALEDGRVEWYFGKADAREAMAALRDRVARTDAEIRALGREANADAKAALQRIKVAYESISRRLLN